MLRPPRTNLQHFDAGLVRDQQPHGEYARWTLFLIAQYFGWVGLIRRYTDYGQDQNFVEFTEKIRGAFANHRPWGNTPFRFGRPEQTALGQSAVMQRSGEFGSEFDSVPIYEFIENLGNENEFAKSKTITATIEALRAADRADMLQGHGRIGSIQSLLVELLNYVEGKEGFSLFVHDELDV